MTTQWFEGDHQYGSHYWLTTTYLTGVGVEQVWGSGDFTETAMTGVAEAPVYEDRPYVCVGNIKLFD